jgi:nitroreductase
MSVLDVIKKRRSTRKYKEDEIPEEVLHRVLEAARLAPSGKNYQPWKLVLVKDKELKVKLAQAARGQMFIAEAPVIIAACGFPEQSYGRQGNYMRSWPIDVTIAIAHLMLQAAEDGLGTCWIGAFEEKEVKPLLGIPDDVRVLALTPLGYPDESPPDQGRKPMDEIISYDKF